MLKNMKRRIKGSNKDAFRLAVNDLGNLANQLLKLPPDERPNYIQPITTSYFDVAKI